MIAALVAGVYASSPAVAATMRLRFAEQAIAFTLENGARHCRRGLACSDSSDSQFESVAVVSGSVSVWEEYAFMAAFGDGLLMI